MPSSPKASAKAQGERILGVRGNHRRCVRKINGLTDKSQFGVVVFVQHQPTKRSVLSRTRLSFVACLGLFGSYRNCDGGGHPEVAPLGGSLKSLALMRECPKARSG